MTPPSRYATKSQRSTVDNLWATMRQVRPAINSSMADVKCRSVRTSSEEVASSRTTIEGSRNNALAMPTRCRSPPLSFSPRSPTGVSSPWGRASMVSLSWARWMARSTSASVASGLP
mmetsp:Transcript_10800/g.31229  ORF Transcript_10800/g.31229 Transcript_10800/m.31229 type:complete len:117 (+) Transcript_10800:110-460(+)